MYQCNLWLYPWVFSLECWRPHCLILRIKKDWDDCIRKCGSELFRQGCHFFPQTEHISTPDFENYYFFYIIAYIKVSKIRFNIFKGVPRISPWNKTRKQSSALVHDSQFTIHESFIKMCSISIYFCINDTYDYTLKFFL